MDLGYIASCQFPQIEDQLINECREGLNYIKLISRSSSPDLSDLCKLLSLPWNALYCVRGLKRVLCSAAVGPRAPPAGHIAGTRLQPPGGAAAHEKEPGE